MTTEKYVNLKKSNSLKGKLKH